MEVQVLPGKIWSEQVEGERAEGKKGGSLAAAAGGEGQTS